MKISHPGQQFQVPYPVGIQVKGYFNLWHLRNLVAGMMWILVSGSNNEWLTSYHWWLTTLQVRESRFLGYHQKKWDPYFESANAHLPQSLPILFHSSYPLESFTSNPPHHSSLPKPPFDMFRIPQPHEELVGYHPSWRSPASDYPCREDTQDMLENDVPSFLFPFGWDMALFPWRVSIHSTSRGPSLVVLPFCSDNFEKVPQGNLPGHAAFTLVDLGVKRCMRLSNQTLALRDSQFAAENWCLEENLPFGRRKLFPMLCWVQGCCFSVAGV